MPEQRRRDQGAVEAGATFARRVLRSGRVRGAHALRRLANLVDPPRTDTVVSETTHEGNAEFTPPWEPLNFPENGRVVCNICRWVGDEFIDPGHCEKTVCPRCNSIGRDRFLFHCWMTKGPVRPGLRILETSPRLGASYQDAMSQWFDYLASDYDERAHKTNVRLDIQDLELSDDSLDVVLTPHVLEHVPDTGRALDELRRVLAPNGRIFLQVPVLQGVTAPPREPEFHGDDTPVFWRFGFDLTARLRDHGFVASLLCVEPWYSAVISAATEWPSTCAPEFDVADMLKESIADDLEVVADAGASHKLGLTEPYMYLTWACSLDPSA